MIKLKNILSESCSVPTSQWKVREYLTTQLQDADTTPEVFEKLNQMRKSWTDIDYNNAMHSGACESWNVVISPVLDNKGLYSQVHHGIPDDDDFLPSHYYCSVGQYIIDFVVGQFWGYGLARNINDAEKAVFTQEEYQDILDAYNWF